MLLLLLLVLHLGSHADCVERLVAIAVWPPQLDVRCWERGVDGRYASLFRQTQGGRFLVPIAFVLRLSWQTIWFDIACLQCPWGDVLLMYR